MDLPSVEPYLDVVAVTQTSKLLLACGVPHIEPGEGRDKRCQIYIALSLRSNGMHSRAYSSALIIKRHRAKKPPVLPHPQVPAD